MRKILSMVLVATTSCVFLVGCGGKPSDVSWDVYNLGVEACDALDDYIQGKMTQDTCYEKLEDISDRAEEIKEEIDEENISDSLVLMEISNAYRSVSSAHVEEGETYKAEDTLGELKEELNLK